MKSHLRKELEKYTKGPLNQLIALLMCGARFPQDHLGQRSPSESSTKEALVSLIWQKFDFSGDVRTTDESSLNLLVLLKVDQACLRRLIAETDYTVDPVVYSNTCIKALECLTEIRYDYACMETELQNSNAKIQWGKPKRLSAIGTWGRSQCESLIRVFFLSASSRNGTTGSGRRLVVA